jgi:hypothetical protein
MAKINKDKQFYTKHIEERQTIPWPKPTRTNNVILNTNIVCSCWFWPWYCLIFCDVFYITLFFLVGFGHGIVLRSSMCFVLPWPKPTRTNNVMQSTSKNVRQYHGQNQQGKTMLYKAHRTRSDNTINCLSLLILAIVLSDVLRCV